MEIDTNIAGIFPRLAFTRGFARKFQNVLKLCFYFHVLW
jgi:hypothetical protein